MTVNFSPYTGVFLTLIVVDRHGLREQRERLRKPEGPRPRRRRKRPRDRPSRPLPRPAAHAAGTGAARAERGAALASRIRAAHRRPHRAARAGPVRHIGAPARSFRCTSHDCQTIYRYDRIAGMNATTTEPASAYERLGVHPIVNACGIYTDLGGSTLSPSVWAALGEANATWASIPELLDATGRRIAELIDAEAARVVPGASAAIALSTAACIAGLDGDLNERLPTGAPDRRQVVLQAGHRYKYTRCALLAGAEIVEAGDPDGTTSAQLADALGERTAAILLPAHLDGHHGTVPLAGLAPIARAQGVPVIVDAAYLSYPTELLPSFTRAGADLVCFSAKYFWGPNAGGFVAGRRDLVEAVAELDFTRYEGGPRRTFGRPFKLDRTTILGTLLALEEWLAMDHDARWAGYARRIEAMRGQLAGVERIATTARQFTLDERIVEEAPNALVVEPRAAGAAAAIEAALADGAPRILCVRDGERLVFAVETIPEALDATVVERIRAAAEALA
jgi:L-seryl-tRNA(Ser) seleniumtransferase